MLPRTLFIDHTGSLGGAELYLLDLVRATPDSTVLTFERGPLVERLHAQGHDVRVVEAPASVLRVQKTATACDAIAAIPGLTRMIANVSRVARDYDVVFLNSQKAMLIGALASWLANRPAIWSLHDILSNDHFSRTNRFLATRMSNAFVDRVVVNSQATEAAYRSSGGRRPTEVVYNGIEEHSHASTSSQNGSIRRELNLGDTPLVGIFSRLAPWKGQHVLIDALASLPTVHALVVGDALFPDDVAYADEIRDRCEKRDVADRVHFLGFRDDIPRLMQEVDAVVHASTAPEPFGRVVVEGMLANRPVVASRAGGVKEIIDHRRTGYFAEPGDAQSLASVLEQIFENGRESTIIARRGREVARHRFSVKQMTHRLHDVLRQTHADHASHEPHV
ncbi:glycosyl transferase family 1 [Longibacter salinarum]|uniref:Glycosyl transferase family 1 n=1 Tax=Longibacter salinarum TaxID=1850348 RepID=A0A2A8CVV1_9BACT|nr:glycosyltransferase family 4 protein [Longibacter salinarum]PEN12812.1 glycosyl transferase family 1 [Longibacter salinarum]